MIEWRDCPRCHRPMSIVPVSSLFDRDGKKYGGLFRCKHCEISDYDFFLNYDQIQELIKQQEKDKEKENNE